MKLIKPTIEQCETLYRVCNELTVYYIHSIDLIRVDERTRNIVGLYVEDGYLEIDASGKLVPAGLGELRWINQTLTK